MRSCAAGRTPTWLIIKLLQDPTGQGHHETQGAGTMLTSEGLAILRGPAPAIVSAPPEKGVEGTAMFQTMTAW